MYFNPFGAPAIIACIISLLVGIYVFFQNPKNIQNRVFVLLIFFVIAFCFGESLLRFSSTSEEALLWGRIAYIGVIFVPLTSLHLTFVFPRERAVSKKSKIYYYALIGLYLIGIISLFIFIIIVTLKDVQLSTWGYRLSMSPSFSFIGILVVAVLFYAIFNLIRNYRISKSLIEKKQIRYVFYGALLVVLLTSTTNVILPLLDISIFPLASFGLVILVLFVGAAVLKHSLFIYRPMAETIIESEKMALLNRDELEKEVRARTIALLKANAELGLENIERKRVEEQIRKSLEEKETLLKEVHHRVKNNLQIISSLLYLQSNKIKDKRINDAILEIHNRISSMSLIHERLHQSENLAEIDFKDYVQKLVHNLLHSYGINVDDIKININVDNVVLDIDTAIPSGLIINELVSNSLKHAFPNDQEKEIYINLYSENGKIILVIGDNGIGLPNDLNIQKIESLGLSLVKNLVNQLNGKLEFRNDNGAEFKIIFTVLKDKNRELLK